MHKKWRIHKRLPMIFLSAICVLLGGGLWFSATPVRAAGFPIIGVLHAGGHPEALAIDQQSHRLYIAYESPGTVVCFEPNSGQVCWRTALGDEVTDLQVDSSSHTVFAVYNVYHTNRGYLGILNGENGQAVSHQVAGAGENTLAYDAKQQKIYVASQNDGTVHTLTFPRNWQQAGSTIQVSQQKIGSEPDALAVNSRLGRLYVADRRENVLRVFDEKTGQLTSTIHIGAIPLPPIRIDEQSGRIFVLASGDQELEVIDGEHNKVSAETAVGPYPEGLAIQTATGRIYVADEGDNEAGNGTHNTGTTISVLDGQSYELLGTMQVGAAPDGVEADPGLHRIYVATEDANAVVELSDSPDLPLQTSGTIQQRDRAQTFAFWLRQADWFTLIGMTATLILATLGAGSQRRRGQESLQTQPESGSSH